VAEALALCRQDSELAAWLERHCAMQMAIRSQFQAMAIPEGLRQQIISEYTPRTEPVWWRRPAVLAVAATVLFAIAISAFWLNLPRAAEQDVSFAAFRNRMVRAIVRTYAVSMELETNNAAQIRAHLAQRQAPADYRLPERLAQAETVGCGALSWQGKPVAMVCFRTGKPLPPDTKSDLFLFVINDSDLAASPQFDTPQFANVSTLVTASWREGGKVYVLAGLTEADVKQRL
jgi:hypothetical protein